MGTIVVMLTSQTGSSIRLEPNLPQAESVRAYLVKARALLIIIIIIQVYCPYEI
jgi:hypothetical protein